MRAPLATCLLLVLTAAACGPKTLEQRMKYADKLCEEADTHLRAAEQHLRALEPKRAEDELEEAKDLLSEKDSSLSPEYELMKGRYDELASLLPVVKEQRRKRDLDEAVRERRSKIGPILQAAKDAADALSGKGLDEEKLKTAQRARDALDDELDDDVKELMKQDEDFASYIKRARGELSNVKDAIALAEAKLAFIKGPIAARDEANTRLKNAKKERDLEKKVELIKEALQLYKGCVKDARHYASKPALAKEPVFIANRPLLADDVAHECDKAQQPAEKQLDVAKKALAKEQAKTPKKKKK